MPYKSVKVYVDCPLCDPNDESKPEHRFEGIYLVTPDFIDYRNGGGEQGDVVQLWLDVSCGWHDRKKVGHDTLTAEERRKVQAALDAAFIDGDYEEE